MEEDEEKSNDFTYHNGSLIAKSNAWIRGGGFVKWRKEHRKLNQS